ncbi:MAG: DISARM system SNF2-like helicase DrmD [Planctomycetes bacterium]|nr:DISARM system SNF2-like helicase DrmD [Planctomycetota bacterium]
MEPVPGKIPGLEPGGVVRVRSRRWLVEQVSEPTQAWESPLVRLSCVEDDALGEQVQVLWDHELDARVEDTEKAWDLAARRGYDEPRVFSAYLNTLRWNCVTATDPKLFQAPYRAGIEVKAYQLEPLRKALLMPRVNLFIADDVGLGKTIEAGLILRELILRQKVRRVLVCCPPSVVTQWRDEMEQRFGLTFAIYDREFVARTRQERGYAVNPWTTHSRFVISQALVRDERYANDLAVWLGDFAHDALLILDEAHNAAPASGSKYAIDSHVTRAIRELAPRFEHRLFLSATPHNGHSNSFSALLEILDPQRFCRGVRPTQKLLDDVMVRRLKQDLREIGEEFPKRHVTAVVLNDVPATAPEVVLSDMLQRYRLLREERLSRATRKQRAAAMLVITSLQKRLLSSIEAFSRTLDVHRKSVVRDAAEADAKYDDEPEEDDLPLLAASCDADDDRSELSEDDVEAEADAEMEAASRASGGPAAALKAELEIVDEMRAIARSARFEPDARVRWFLKWIRDTLCPDLGKPGARWNERRVLVFTEYTDTKRYLVGQIENAIAKSDRADARLATFHGGIGEQRRQEVKDAFNADPAQHSLRILVATDAAREGVNLQNHCADLFHFDVPWNPSRMEQRNGRIDRKLQRAKEVTCRYFVIPRRAEDRVLEVLVSKTKTILAELGSLTPVVARRAERLLASGIRTENEAALKQQIEDIDHERHVIDDVSKEELEAARVRQDDLRKQLQVLDGMLQASRDWIGLDVRHFRDALSAALYATAMTELTPTDAGAAAKDPDAAEYVVPAIHEQRGADPTWAATLDTLRVPKKKGQTDGEWRATAAIRPVVFRDPRNLDGAVVHLHLEHRLVQRLLGRFLAQGFLADDLKRVCIVRTDDAVPRVLVLGRLSLHGENAGRLHDEVLTVAADWEDPAQRGRRKLRPLDVGTTKEVLRLLDEALATPRLREVPDAARELLLAGVGQDVRDLRGALTKRAESIEQAARKDLVRRGESESNAMRQILEDQRKRIEARAREVDRNFGQLVLGFSEDDRRQLDLDRGHWRKRLAQLAEEIESEPVRVRRTYEVKARRVEPVGVVYLWPVSR